MLGALTSCDKYNTDVIGEKFAPINSLVTKFRQLVYVEYQDGKAKVWGPYADLVDFDIDGSSVSIKSDLDSLVVVAYGYAVEDSVHVFSGNLSINSTMPYALYLNNLQIQSESGVAIQSLGSSECFLVVPDKGKNKIIGGFSSEGPVIFDGKGSLDILAENTALTAKRGMTCSYPLTVNIESKSGDGVHVENGDVKIADGTWNVKAGNNAFSNVEGQVILNGGKVIGYAQNGSFVSTPESFGIVVNECSCIGVGATASVLAPEQRQFVWHLQIDYMSFTKGQKVTINRMPNGDDAKPSKLETITPEFDYKTPWLLISNASLKEVDSVTLSNE